MDSDVSWLFMGITYSMVKQRPRSSPGKTRMVTFPGPSGSFREAGVQDRPPWKPVDAVTLDQGDPFTSRASIPSWAGQDSNQSMWGTEIRDALAQALRALPP